MRKLSILDLLHKWRVEREVVKWTGVLVFCGEERADRKSDVINLPVYLPSTSPMVMSLTSDQKNEIIYTSNGNELFSKGGLPLP